MLIRKYWRIIGLACAGYVLLILGHGYVFGHLGMIETMPYLKDLSNPALYPNDFYIDGIQEKFPDVRWVFVQFLKLFGITNPWRVFVVHFIISISLLLGLLKVALLFLKNEVTAFWAVMLALLVLYNHNLGGNELYYNSLAPSLMAKSIGIWCVYFFLRRRDNASYLLLIPTTFIHPMVGVQLFLIMLITSIWLRFSKKKNKISFGSIVTYLLTAGSWIVYLKFSFSDNSIESQKVFEVLHYRLAHHYFPSTYPIGDYGLLIPFFVVGWLFFWMKNRQVFLFYTIAILGLLFYSVGVEYWHSLTILSAQWFKTTIWLKFFSSIAVVAIIKKFVFGQTKRSTKIFNLITWVTFLGLGLFLGLKLPDRHPITLDLPWRDPYNDRIEIALLAKAITPKEAIFITDSDFTHLKYFGERSTFVDYKATIHERAKLVSWYKRINEAYVNTASRAESLPRLMGELVVNGDIEVLDSLGITHILSKKKYGATVVGEVGAYKIYEISLK